MTKPEYPASRHWETYHYHDGSFRVSEKYHYRRQLAVRFADVLNPSCPLSLPTHFFELGSGIDPMSITFLVYPLGKDLSLTLSDPGYKQAITRETVLQRVYRQFHTTSQEEPMVKRIHSRHRESFSIERAGKTLTLHLCDKGLPNVEPPSEPSLLHCVSVASYVDKDDLFNFIKGSNLWGFGYLNSIEAGSVSHKMFRHQNCITDNSDVLSHLPKNMILLDAISRKNPVAYGNDDLATLYVKANTPEEKNWLTGHQIIQKITAGI